MSDQKPPPKLSLPQRALLLILMAENAELCNADIRTKYMPNLELSGKPRTQLSDELKFIDCRKGPKNANFFTLTEEGWRWCREELAQSAPAGARAGGEALYAVLGGLGQFLDRTGFSLAQIFGGLPIVVEGGTSDVPPTPDEIEQAIRRAYRKLTESAGAWIKLADIRDELGDIPKPQVDGVLKLMTRMPGVQVEEQTNQKQLDVRDRAAAVNIGGRDQHILAIGES
jgi:hypothetical protein